MIDIIEELMEIILTCRMSVLTDSKSTWIKNCMDNFDVHIGAYDLAQTADLIGVYILDTLGRIIDFKRVGLIREDGLIFIPDSNSPKKCFHNF